MYALNLNEDNRILSATLDEFAPEEQPRVNELPDGDITDYKYVNNEYVYDPIPGRTTPEDQEIKGQLMAKASQNERLQANNSIQEELVDVLKQHDDLTDELYKSISANAITNTKVFSESYARKIMRGELTIDDVPDELKTEVQSIIDSKIVASINLNGSHSLFDGNETITKSVQRNSYKVLLEPDDTLMYRVPDADELIDEITITCDYDRFFQRCINYQKIDMFHAALEILIPEEVEELTIKLDCIQYARSEKKKGAK